MARFEVEHGGQRYEVEAPDEKAALALFDQSAPPASDQTQQPQRAPTMTTGQDVAQSLETGLRKGALSIPGLPGSIEQLGRMGINWAGRKMGAEGDVVSPETALPTAARYQELHENITPEAQAYNTTQAAREGREPDGPHPFHRPQTRAGRYAETIGEFAPGAALPGGVAQRIIRGVAAPAVASEAAGQATEGTAAEPYARVAGALLGPSVPTLARRAITPFPATPERTAAAKLLKSEGVELTAGQRTGNRNLQFAESAARETPFAGGRTQEMLDQQGRQFSRAALRRVGEDADLALPDTMRAASQRIGAEFDRLTANNNLVLLNPQTGRIGPAGQQLAQRVDQLERQYEAVIMPSQYHRAVEDITDDILRAVASGQIEGRTYQGWRSKLGMMADDAQDPALRRYFTGLQHALDDTMQSTIPAADAAAWQTARQQWGHLVELRQAMLGAGEQVATGVVTPARLAMADRGNNATRYVEGTGRYDDLARAGVQTMSPLPNSGTPARLHMMHTVPAALTTGAGFAVGNVPGAVAGAAAGAVLGPAVMGRAITSRPAQAYLGNQLVGEGPRTTTRQRMLSALLGGQNDASQR